MKVNILFIFVFFVLVDSQTELKYDILGCPFGWKASGQAWYAPKYEETWTNINPAFAAATSYSSSFQYPKQNGYFPREYIVCLICKNDLMSIQESSRYKRLIEVCGTNSTEIKSKQLHFEMQECYIYNGQNGVKKYYTYGFTLNWCLNQPICAINVSLSFNFLYNSLKQASPILCSEFSKHSAAKDKNLNPYKFVDLVCPSGFFTKIEMHNTLCKGVLKSSLCILCSSEESEFSVCYCKGCEEISENINLNYLVDPNSKLPVFNFDAKRYCGVQIDLDLTSYEFVNETNLIVCSENGSENANVTNRIVCIENAMAISLAVFCVTTLILIIIVVILSIKIFKTNKTGRQQSQEQDPPLADHVYYNTNEPGNRENHREDGNIEFLHVNPYYE
jgi:hypothetical protein